MSDEDEGAPGRSAWRTELVEETRQIRARRRVEPVASSVGRALRGAALRAPEDLAAVLRAPTAPGAVRDRPARTVTEVPSAPAAEEAAPAPPAAPKVDAERPRPAWGADRLRALEDAEREANARARLWTAEEGATTAPKRRPRPAQLGALEAPDRAVKEGGRLGAEARAERPTPRAPAEEAPHAPPAREPSGRPRHPPPPESGPEAPDGTELDIPAMLGAGGLPLGTSEIPVELRRQAILLEKIPPLSADTLRPLAAALPAEHLVRLDAVLLGAHEPPNRDAAVSPKRALEHLVHEGGLERLAPDEQRHLLEPMSVDPSDVSAPKAALALLRSNALFELPAPERKMACSLFAGLGPEGRVLLAKLAARRLRLGSALGDRADDGVDLSTHLLAVLRDEGQEAALAALEPLAAPAGLAPGEGEEAVAVALEHLLADAWPAEHARLRRQLGSGRRAARLAGGSPLSAAAGTAALRGAFLGLPASCLGGRARTPGFLFRGGRSLDAEVVAKSVEQVFGARATLVVEPSAILRRLAQLEELPTRPPIVISLLTDHGERLFAWRGRAEHGARVASPQGRRKGALAPRLDPPRRVIDPALGLDEIPLELFEERLGLALFPPRAHPSMK